MGLSGARIAAAPRLAAAAAALLALAACESWNWKTPADYLGLYGVETPADGRVVVCHGYGCRFTTEMVLDAATLVELRATFRPAPADAAAERRRLAAAVALLERRIGADLGTGGDVGGFHPAGIGDPGQQDCIDEAATTTGYLLLLGRLGLMRRHTVEAPAVRGALLDGRWPHAAAVIAETASGRRYAVDSWPGPNGAPPRVQTLEAWLLSWT